MAGAESIEIDTVQLSSATPKNDALISEVDSPSEVKVGEPFNMRVLIDSNSGEVLLTSCALAICD